MPQSTTATAGSLYLVATPIGNLQDMTFRAVAILKLVGVIACEDTRHTRKLLNHFEISNKLLSYHEHNEVERAGELIKLLESGTSVAVVSDAGTPGVCDPGFRLVQMAIEAGIPVIPIPGAVAFVNALVASGLPTDAAFFAGFLPSKKNDRRKRLEELSQVPGTLIFYEAPRRIESSIADCLEILGDRQAVVARELTKLHEQFYRGNLSDIRKGFSSATFKGEAVLLIDRNRATNTEIGKTSSLMERLAELEGEGVDHKAALKQVAKEFGVSKSEAYRRVQTARNDGTN